MHKGAPSGRLRSGVNIDYRALFDAVPGLYVVLAPDLTLLALTDAYARATLVDRDAVIGQSLFEVFPGTPDAEGARSTRLLRESLERVLAQRLPDTMDVLKYSIQQADGTYVERYWTPINTPVLGEDGEILYIMNRVEDVTEIVRLHSESAARDQALVSQQALIDEMRAVNAELARTLAEVKRLEDVRRHFQDIVESSNDAIVGRSVDGSVTSWNKAAEDIYGYRADEIIGQPVSKLAPIMHAHDAHIISEALARGESVTQYETTRVRRDGTEFPVSISASLVRNSVGEITGSSAIVRDITERKRNEEKLRDLQAELIHLSRWNTMGMMSSTLAHELNQPLAAIMNYVRAARRTIAGLTMPETVRATDHLDKAAEEATLASGIIRSLREFIEKREGRRRPENINAVVEEAMALSLIGSSGGRIRPKVVLDPILQPVLVDKIQIEQVMLNLIRNAIEAMEGEGALMITTGSGEQGFVEVSIADTGPGLPPEVAERLFQPFTTTKTNGMGIGLTICQSILEAHGGRIWAQPVSPKGVCFRFQLPAVTEPADE